MSSTNNFEPISAVGSFYVDRDSCINRNVDRQGKNSRYEIIIPGGVQTTSRSKLSIGSIKIPNSWYNISTRLGNNQLTIVAPFASGSTSIAVTIPDGFYDIVSLNSYLQSIMVSNGLYLINNTTGQYVYFFDMALNLPRYRLQFNSYPFPYISNAAVTAAGYTSGGGINFTGAAQAGVSITIPASLYEYMGLVSVSTSLTVPSVSSVSSTSLLSDVAPDQFPVKSILVHISIANNRRNTILYRDPNTQVVNGHGATTVVSVVQINVPYGQDIHGSQFLTTWVPLLETNNSTIQVWMTDQELGDLFLQDDSSVLEFLITQTQ